MGYVRFIFGVCALSMMIATIAFGHSLEYRAGRAAAYIDHCGHYDLNLALHKKYGKSQDYKTGELDTALQTGKGSSHKVNNLGCEELEGFIKKLFNASAQASNINEAENIPFICRMAFNNETGRWMEPTNGVHWYPYEVQGEFVNRARLQGLSEQDCASILGHAINVTPASKKSISEKEIDKLHKKNARLKKQQQSQPKPKPKQRDDIDRVIERECSIIGVDVKDQFAFQNKCFSSLKKISQSARKIQDSDVCEHALANNRVAWEYESGSSQIYVAEAKYRTLSAQDCFDILERKAPASGKSIAEKENERLLQEIARLKKQQQSQPKQIAKKPVKKSPPTKAGGTGSGFFVSKLGHIVTNEHVVRSCGSITVGDSATKQVEATLVEKDKRNDLALLRISSTQMASAESKSLISKLGIKVEISTPNVPLASEGLFRSDDVELGEDLLVSGYPYGDLFSNTIKVTKGIVSANRGMGDDSSQFQMDAAVQAGNSGGPIYDENGNIVGVVVQQLNRLNVAKTLGSMPELVNFGIKASTVRQFLTSAGLPTKWSNRSKRRSTKDLAKIAKNQTVMIVCNP